VRRLILPAPPAAACTDISEGLLGYRSDPVSDRREARDAAPPIPRTGDLCSHLPTIGFRALGHELRRQHPRRGVRRIVQELGLQGVTSAPSRATVHPVLVRNGLVSPQQQEHKRKYRRWQREAPMHLGQLDLVGGIPLADGRECKMVTGIDDHSRFVVIAAVVAVPSGRAVCSAFTTAMRRYGVPFEVLSDNGKQFTGRNIRPQPVEVLLERVCRQNGINRRLTKPRSPTTTGKIERFHKTLRRELLDHVTPFESPAAAQEAIEGWVRAYNHARPSGAEHGHPGERVPPARPGLHGRGTGGIRREQHDGHVADRGDRTTGGPARRERHRVRGSYPTQWRSQLVPDRQRFSLPRGLAGRTVTVWADLRSLHILLEGHLVRTVVSRLLPQDLADLVMRYGARPVGPAPAAPALRQVNGNPVLAADQMRDRLCPGQANHHDPAGRPPHARHHRRRFGGHLAVPDHRRAGRPPARSPHRVHSAAASALVRRIDPGPATGARQRPVHGERAVHQARAPARGKLVTVVIEDTHYRVLHGEEELAIRPRRDTTPITRLYVRGKGTNPAEVKNLLRTNG
jgi:transposase InsO family protein